MHFESIKHKLLGSQLRVTVGVFLLSALSGYMAFRQGGGPYLVLLFAVALGQTRTSAQAAVACWCYLLGVSATIHGAFAVFFPSWHPLLTWVLWLAYPLPAALLAFYCLKRQADLPREFLATLVFLVLGALPPVGVLFAGHPVFAAADIFPSMGIASQCAIIVLFASLACLNLSDESEQTTPVWAAVVGLVVVSFAVAVVDNNRDPQAPENFVPISTQFGKVVPSPLGDYTHLSKITTSIRDGNPSANTLVILPESISAPSSAARLAWWRSELSEFFQGGGGVLIGEASLDLGKSAALITASGYDWVPARQSTPFGEVNTALGNGYQSFGWGSSIIKFDGRRIAVVQCYEVLVPWLAIKLAFERPDLVVYQSNQWWATTSDVHKVLDRHAAELARTLGVPFIAAVNR